MRMVDCGLYGGTILQDADFVADATVLTTVHMVSLHLTITQMYLG